MRVPISWLREYVDIQMSPEQLAERLTLLGMEVKGIEQWGSDWRSVVVGELLTVEKHPFGGDAHLLGPLYPAFTRQDRARQGYRDALTRGDVVGAADDV